MGCDYLTFLDDDDEMHPNALALARNAILANPGYGWYMANTGGDVKKASRHIVSNGAYDWVDDYLYGKRLRGDKAEFISRDFLGGIRFDARYRASNMWPLRLALANKTKIFGFTDVLINKSYQPDGITKTSGRGPKSLLDIYSRFGRHAAVIASRPTCFLAYKYFSMEFLKSFSRVIRLFFIKL